MVLVEAAYQQRLAGLSVMRAIAGFGKKRMILTKCARINVG
jgi:PII-like signaling protein